MGGGGVFYMHYDYHDKRYSRVFVTFYPDIWPLYVNDSVMLNIYWYGGYGLIQSNVSQYTVG